MKTFISGLLITGITSLVAWLSSRANAKANMTNVATSGRVEMEKEAYERARALDTETITRQDKELHDLRDENHLQKEALEEVQAQNRQLNDDVARISRDNYDLTRQNSHIIEQNEQILAENRRLRAQGERIMIDNSRLHEEVGVLRQRITKAQRGMNPDSSTPIRERETDTNPMMPEVDRGRE